MNQVSIITLIVIGMFLILQTIKMENTSKEIVG